MESTNPSAVITTVGSHQRAYAAPNTYIRVRVAGIGMGQVRYVTDDGYLGVHFAGDPAGRVDEIGRDLLTAISIGGPALIDQLFAALRPPATVLQWIPIVVAA